jgi:hypothetical protein
MAGSMPRIHEDTIELKDQEIEFFKEQIAQLIQSISQLAL